MIGEHQINYALDVDVQAVIFVIMAAKTLSETSRVIQHRCNAVESAGRIYSTVFKNRLHTQTCKFFSLGPPVYGRSITKYT